MTKANHYNLVIIDPSSGRSEHQERVSFASLGVKRARRVSRNGCSRTQRSSARNFLSLAKNSGTSTSPAKTRHLGTR